MPKDVALIQLAAWQELAVTWPISIVYFDESNRSVETPVDGESSHAACGECTVSIYAITDRAGNKYTYQPGQELAMVVAHLRNFHRELEPKIIEITGGL
jgi:hypothetical protein